MNTTPASAPDEWARYIIVHTIGPAETFSSPHDDVVWDEWHKRRAQIEAAGGEILRASTPPHKLA